MSYVHYVCFWLDKYALQQLIFPLDNGYGPDSLLTQCNISNLKADMLIHTSCRSSPNIFRCNKPSQVSLFPNYYSAIPHCCQKGTVNAKVCRTLFIKASFKAYIILALKPCFMTRLKHFHETASIIQAKNAMLCLFLLQFYNICFNKFFYKNCLLHQQNQIILLLDTVELYKEN